MRDELISVPDLIPLFWIRGTPRNASNLWAVRCPRSRYGCPLTGHRTCTELQKNVHLLQVSTPSARSRAGDRMPPGEVATERGGLPLSLGVRPNPSKHPRFKFLASVPFSPNHVRNPLYIYKYNTRNRADKRQSPGLRPALGGDTATLKM